MRPTITRTHILGAALAAPLALGAAGSASAAEFANVVSKTAITRQVAVPVQNCQTQLAPVLQPHSDAGAIVGGVAGGLLGSTVGRGAGKAVAAVAGVVAGAVAGDRIDNPPGPVATQPVQVCANATQYENRIVGYDVVYEYNGRQYSTRMDRDPGDRIAVAVVPEGAGAPVAPPVNVYPAPVTYPAPAAYPAPVVYPAPVYAPPYYPAYGPAVVVRPYFGGYWGYGHGYGHRHW